MSTLTLALVLTFWQAPNPPQDLRALRCDGLPCWATVNPALLNVYRQITGPRKFPIR